MSAIVGLGAHRDWRLAPFELAPRQVLSGQCPASMFQTATPRGRLSIKEESWTTAFWRKYRQLLASV
jgi:hypothetical protein